MTHRVGNPTVVPSHLVAALEPFSAQDHFQPVFIGRSPSKRILIEESWAREALIPPYHVYLKIAYHLSHEARAGLAEFRIPRVFGDRLFDFQAAAVKIAAHHLNKRNGVLIGDVVGLGKTLMATAVARVFEDDFGLETLIICPKNLVPMWKDYAHEYQLRAKVLSLSRVLTELATLRRYRLVVIDESHNLRNREGRRYRAIQEYVRANESKCMLLSATPYNKTYLDLSSQLRIFVEDDQDLGIRPERLLRELGEVEFSRRHQASPRTLAAFDFSQHADDWRDLMRLYLVRRTRSFIQDNYAETEEDTGRKFLTYEDGSKSFFPIRVPKTVKFAIDESDPNDQYAQLYSDTVIDTVNALHLPRYGLGNYLADNSATLPTAAEKHQLDDLSRAGKRLMGFCRTNLFKRLESSGSAFLQSVARHALRNYVFLHAIKNALPLPLGTQDAELLDSRFTDEDADAAKGSLLESDDDDQEPEEEIHETGGAWTNANFELQAAQIYAQYAGHYKRRFKWLRSTLFRADLDVDREGRSITESQLEVLSAAECGPDTPALSRYEDHHRLAAEGVKHVVREEKRVGGQLGRPSGARFRTYTRLKQYAEAIKGQLFDVDALHKAIDDIYRYPLRPAAVDTLNRQLRSGVDDAQLADIVMSLREEDRLCLAADDVEAQEPQIICSLGLFRSEDDS